MSTAMNFSRSLPYATMLDLLRRLTKLPVTEYISRYEPDMLDHYLYLRLTDSTILKFAIPDHRTQQGDASIAQYISSEVRDLYPELYI